MSDDKTAVQEIESFLDSWKGDTQPMRDWFRLYYKELALMENVTLSFCCPARSQLLHSSGTSKSENTG